MLSFSFLHAFQHAFHLLTHFFCYRFRSTPMASRRRAGAQAAAGQVSESSKQTAGDIKRFYQQLEEWTASTGTEVALERISALGKSGLPGFCRDIK
jgi:hypothetical protein